MTEIDILIKNLKPPVFRFIIIKSIHPEQAISLVKKKIKENLPNKKSIVLKTEGKDYRELMDFVYANAKNIILIQDFDKLANNKDVSIGFNQRRDKLADLNLAILAFVPDNNGVQDIMNNLPDLWSFRSSIIEFEFEPLQEKKKAEKTGEIDSDITYIEHNTAKKEYKTIIKRIKNLDIIDENLPLLNASYIRLFDTCYSLGKYKEGLDFTKKLYDIAVKFDYEEKIPKLYSDILDWLGRFYYELSEYNKATSYFEKALNINIKAFGEEYPNTAKSFNSLGVAWQALGEYEKAINYYNKALNINIK
jgi:tetratricopeptide (TPR) repeat protein